MSVCGGGGGGGGGGGVGVCMGEGEVGLPVRQQIQSGRPFTLPTEGKGQIWEETGWEGPGWVRVRSKGGSFAGLAVAAGSFAEPGG